MMIWSKGMKQQYDQQENMYYVVESVYDMVGWVIVEVFATLPEYCVLILKRKNESGGLRTVLCPLAFMPVFILDMEHGK